MDGTSTQYGYVPWANAEERQMFMYGCLSTHLDEAIEDADMPYMGGLPMLVMSMLSDAQELIAMGASDKARQNINRAKYVLKELSE